MNDESLMSLIQLREYVIKNHNMLDGAYSPDTSLIKQREVAEVYTEIIRTIEKMIDGKVKFE